MSAHLLIGLPLGRFPATSNAKASFAMVSLLALSTSPNHLICHSLVLPSVGAIPDILVSYICLSNILIWTLKCTCNKLLVLILSLFALVAPFSLLFLPKQIYVHIYLKTVTAVPWFY